jgi:hypothetical protein
LNFVPRRKFLDLLCRRTLRLRKHSGFGFSVFFDKALSDLKKRLYRFKSLFIGRFTALLFLKVGIPQGNLILVLPFLISELLVFLGIYGWLFLLDTLLFHKRACPFGLFNKRILPAYLSLGHFRRCKDTLLFHFVDL